MQVDAVILAGAPADPDMVQPGQVISRAMIQIGQKTMLQWIVDALKSSKTIGRIVAVGDVSADGLDEVVKPGIGFIENIMLGVRACGDVDQVLVLTSDIPLLTPDAVDDFVTASLETGADMCYPIIPKQVCLEKYPTMKRTCLKTAQGEFTGGNMVLASPEFLKRNETQIAGAYAARKKPLKLASMIGFGTVIRMLIGQVLFPSAFSVPLLEKTLSGILGGSVSAVVSQYPEIGEDVDKISDLEAVRKILV
ncbi:MAG TPA: nucleotidyltransferase family protein [Armatimonadota bacterium]|nr:nucleotidyltransferase family protein [Armatimonadota bacterium]